MKKTINTFLNKIVFAVAFMLAEHVVANEALDIQVGTGLLAFNYVEYDGNNVFLDSEIGLIPGIILKLNSKNKISYTEWVNSLHYNTIKYDGQTQAGTPLKTISDALIFDSHIKIGKKLNTSFGREQSIYTGLGYRYWLRNIRPGFDVNGNPVAGILEEYYWFYGLIGYAVHFDASEKVKLGFDFRLTRMFNAKMDINFLGFRAYDNASVNLGNKTGVRFAVPIEVKLAHSSLFLAPYYEIIDIGRSNNVRIYSGGLATTTVVHEPRSETRNVGVEVTWVW